MNVALLLLALALVSAAVAGVLAAAGSRDLDPGVSGYLPWLIIFAIASMCFFWLGLAMWAASVTMAVLS